jgi:hypothetical protein
MQPFFVSCTIPSLKSLNHGNFRNCHPQLYGWQMSKCWAPVTPSISKLLKIFTVKLRSFEKWTTCRSGWLTWCRRWPQCFLRRLQSACGIHTTNLQFTYRLPTWRRSNAFLYHPFMIVYGGVRGWFTILTYHIYHLEANCHGVQAFHAASECFRDTRGLKINFAGPRSRLPIRPC